MKYHFRTIYKLLVTFGFDFRKTIYAFRGLPLYFKDSKTLKKQQKFNNTVFLLGDPILCLEDRFVESGTASGHYFYQDWFVARRIFLNNPNTHVDVGSRIDGFVAHVASFRSIKVIDIRPLVVKIPNIEFIQADLLQPISDDLVECCDSLSCLHALEHFGLGRYGDPVIFDGYLIGLNNLTRLLKPGGKFYFSIPIGPQRIEFNAHRVFSVEYILELLKGKFTIDSFSFIDQDNQNGYLFENVDLSLEGVRTNFGCTYGCGIFEATKL